MEYEIGEGTFEFDCDSFEEDPPTPRWECASVKWLEQLRGMVPQSLRHGLRFRTLGDMAIVHRDGDVVVVALMRDMWGGEEYYEGDLFTYKREATDEACDMKDGKFSVLMDYTWFGGGLMIRLQEKTLSLTQC
jgi:hypothetical protein